ncbi:hypothetical protein LXL04_024965 [Taraxacum kok-saghyz]
MQTSEQQQQNSKMSCNLSSVNVSDDRSHIDLNVRSDDIPDDLFDEVEELSPIPRLPGRDKGKRENKFAAEQEER